MARRTDIKFDEFRARLVEERNRLRLLHNEQRTMMTEEAEDASENELASFSTFDSAESEDTAAITAEQDREETLDENAVELLQKIDRAMDRLDDGTYGIDEVTGEPIPIERLRAIPWATMTVETAALHEQ